MSDGSVDGVLLAQPIALYFRPWTAAGPTVPEVDEDVPIDGSWRDCDRGGGQRGDHWRDSGRWRHGLQHGARRVVCRRRRIRR